MKRKKMKNKLISLRYIITVKKIKLSDKAGERSSVKECHLLWHRIKKDTFRWFFLNDSLIFELRFYDIAKINLGKGHLVSVKKRLLGNLKMLIKITIIAD